MKQKLLNSFKLRVFMLVAVLCAGFTSAWGQTTVSMTSFSAISGNVDGDANISYEAAKGSASTAPAVNSNEIRVYQNGGTFTVTANNNAKISSITLGSSMGTTVTYSIDGGTASSDQSITANGTITVDNLNCSSVLFTCTGTTKTTRLYVNSLSVTYTGGNSTPTTYTVTFDAGAGTFVGNSDFSSTTNSKEAGTYTLPSATPASGYTFDGWTATGISSPVTDSYTVSSNIAFTASYTQSGSGNIATLTSTNLGLTGSYTTDTEKTIDGITYVYTDLMLSSNRIQAKASTGTIKNTTAYPGYITSVVITHDGTGRATTINGSADGTNWTQVATGSGSITADFSGKGYKYFQITRGSNAAYWTKIEITYSTSSSSLDPCDLTITNQSSALSFDLYNNSNTQIINYTTSSTGAITIEPASPTSYFSYVHDATNKTITVTPLEVTPSAQTVTISQEADDDYYAGTATFTVSVANSDPNVPGTENNPYTVAQALAATPADGVYVTGIISTITEVSTDHGNATYKISDDGNQSSEMIIYRGKYLNGENFTSSNQIRVGDEVIVYGNISVYNNANQMAAGNHLVSISHPSVPFINTESTLSLEYDATSGEIAYTIDNPATGVNLTASLQQGIDWISNITVTSDKVTFTTTANEGNDDRSATITLSYTGATDKVITVTQKHYVADYATLPFSFDGGSSAIANTAGLTQESLGSDYNNSPKLKFDGTGDFVILKINERPGTLSYTIKGNSFSSGSTSTFKVQTSEDGTLYTDLATYTELGDAQNESFSNLGKDVRYIKWIYTEKGATNGGNVALGNISLTAYVTPVPFDLTVTLNDNIDAIFVFNTADENEPLIEDGAAGTVQVVAGTEIMVSPDVASGFVLESLTVGGQDMTSQIDGSGAYTFTMPSQAVTITATAIASAPVTGDKYVKVTSTDDLTDGQYLIVYGEGGVAFDGSLTTLDAVSNTIEVTIDNNEIAVTNNTTAAEFTINVSAGTIQSTSGYYIGETSDANGLASDQTTEYTNTLSIDESGNAVILSSGGAYMRYNSASNQNRFRYFKSSSYTNQKAIQLYKKVAPATESVTVGAAGYTTYVTQNNVSFPDGVNGYIVTSVGTNSIHLEKVTAVPVSTPVVIQAAEGTHQLDVVSECAAVSGNLLHSSNGSVTGDGSSYWALSKFNGVVGFNVVGDGVTIPAGKAYLVINSGSSVKGFLTFDFGSEDAINGIEANTENGVIYNLSGQRLSKPVKGVNIINGRKVLVK